MGFFAPRIPVRLREEIDSLAAQHLRPAEICRAIGEYAEEQGIRRPCYEQVRRLVREHFDLRPAAILRDLDLRRPIYAKTAAYGHFGRDDHDFTWERIDKAQALHEAAGLDGEIAVREPVAAVDA